MVALIVPSWSSLSISFPQIIDILLDLYGLSAWFCSCHFHSCPAWLLVVQGTPAVPDWHLGFLFCACLSQKFIISMIISWWFWVFPYTPRRSLFGKSFLICHRHPFVVRSTLLGPHTDPVDLVPCGAHQCLLVVLRTLVLADYLCATWYSLYLWSSVPLWSWAHHRGTDIRLIDLSACWQSVRTPDGF